MSSSDADEGRVRESDHPPSADAIRVLVVDDEPDLGRLTARFLERESPEFETLVETHPEDALRTLENDRVDCVVSDYQMPGMDGVELLEAVRETDPELPFVLYTGKGSEDVASAAISAGVTDYLQKSGGEEYAVLARQVQTAVERRRAEQRFVSFLESAPDAIAIVGTDGRIEAVNARLEELFGYDRTALLGEPIEVLVPERYRADHVDYREGYVEDPTPRPMGASVDLSAVHADGTEFPVDVSISPVRVGGRLEVMAAVRDVSRQRERERELRERERELARQNEQLERFATIVSHDLRNPLAVATSALSDVRRTLTERETTDGVTDDLDVIEAAHERMDRLVSELLDLSRDGRTAGDLREVGLDAVAREAWNTIPATGGDLTVTTGEAAVFADPQRLHRLFENLYVNAVEATERTGAPLESVAITVGLLPDEAGFFVADDGPGISPEDRDQVLEYGHTSHEEGTGVGLTVVETVAAAQGWTLVLSESESGGARFEFHGVDFE